MHRVSLALALAILILSVSVMWLPGRAKFFSTPRPFTYVPIMWIVLLFASGIKSGQRDPLAAVSGDLSGDNKFELIVYLLVAITVFVVWFSHRPQRSGVREWPVIAWPLFALASTAWSPIPRYTFVKAAQLVIVGALTALCIRLAARRPELRRAMVVDTLRGFIVVTAAFSLWGLVNRSTWEGNRYVWPTGDHPIPVGMVVGAALLLVLVGGRPLTRFPRSIHGSLIILFSVVLILGQNRSILISTSLALIASLWVTRGRRKLAARFIALPALFYGALVLALFGGQGLAKYLERGESAQQLETLTGRTNLWAAALGQIRSPGEWLHGFGYGSPRVILLKLFVWAGHAHNSVIELLLGLGVIGAGVAVVSIGVIGRRAMSARHANNRAIGAAEAAVFVHLAVISIVEAAVVLPGFGFTMLALIFLAVSCPNRLDRMELMNGGLSTYVRQREEREVRFVV
jgi:O-antigen ligase